jgi:hypothetical protein
MLNILKHKIKIFFSIFSYSRTSYKSFYISHQPDSYALNHAHQDFPLLTKYFCQDNQFNNSGDLSRLWLLILNLEKIIEDDIQGDFAELGVWKGNTASIFAYFASKSQRTVHLFDTFSGFNKSDLTGIDGDKAIAFADTSVKSVSALIGNDLLRYCQLAIGHFPASIEARHNRQYAAVSLDCDLYEPTLAGLEFFYPRLAKGGVLFLHDYSSLCWNGSKKAIDEFCMKNNLHVTLMPDKSGTAILRKHSI